MGKTATTSIKARMGQVEDRVDRLIADAARRDSMAAQDLAQRRGQVRDAVRRAQHDLRALKAARGSVIALEQSVGGAIVELASLGVPLRQTYSLLALPRGVGRGLATRARATELETADLSTIPERVRRLGLRANDGDQREGLHPGRL